MNVILELFHLAGGLGLFLYGMHVMSDRIQKRSDNRFRRLLAKLTNNRFAGVATGMGVTSVIQSSSATTVLLVSLVNAGLVTLEQSIGVIMGANIGTTFTAWIVSIVGFKFNISSLALPAIAIALPLYFHKNERWREFAEVLIGFGILFLGLQFMKDAVPDIKNNTDAFSFVTGIADHGYASVLLFVVIGTLITIVVQSSSATMAMTITMAYKGWIGFDLAAAMVLGENIGTTITAYLASLGMNVTAKRTARAHMLFNVFGVCWLLLVFPFFLRLVDYIVPGTTTDAVALPYHLSAFHSIFNVVNTCLLIGFVPKFAILVEKLVKQPAGELREAYHVPFVPSNLPESVESNLISVHREVVKMSELVYDMLIRLMNVTPREAEGLDDAIAEIDEKEALTDTMQEAIVQLLTECMVESLSEQQARRVYAILQITNELERIGDSCANISKLFRQRAKKQVGFHKSGTDELIDYMALVLDFLRYNSDYISGSMTKYDIEHAYELERAIDKQRNKLSKTTRRQLARGADVRGELLFIDVVKNLEHIGDYSLNISQAMREVGAV